MWNTWQFSWSVWEYWGLFGHPCARIEVGIGVDQGSDAALLTPAIKILLSKTLLILKGGQSYGWPPFFAGEPELNQQLDPA